MRLTTPVILAILLAVVGRSSADEPRPVWSETLSDKPPRVMARWLSFSPDGRHLLARATTLALGGSEPSEVWVWDAAAGNDRLRHRLPNGGLDYRLLEFRAPAFAFTADGRVLAVGRRLGLLDLGRGARLGGLPQRKREAVGVWASPDRKQFLLVEWEEREPKGFKREVSVWLVRGAVAPGGEPRLTGEARVPAARDGWWPDQVAVSPDQTRLAAAESAGLLGDRGPQPLRLFRVGGEAAVELTPLARVDGSHVGRVSAAGFGPDGKVLATGSEDGVLKLWEVDPVGDEWKPRATVAGPEYTVTSIAFRPDGQVLAFGTFDTRKPTVWLVDVAAGKLLRSFRARGQVNSVAFSPDGKLLATESSPGVVEVWDADGLVGGK